jgi:hypothetical protein
MGMVREKVAVEVVQVAVGAAGGQVMEEEVEGIEKEQVVQESRGSLEEASKVGKGMVEVVKVALPVKERGPRVAVV